MIMYRKTTSLVVLKVLNRLTTPGILSKPSQSAFDLVTSSQSVFNTAGILSNRKYSTCHCSLQSHRNQNRRRKLSNHRPLGFNDLSRIAYDLKQSQPYLLQRRFVKNDAKLRNDDLTEEEVKVLKQLEREEARFNEDEAKRISTSLPDESSPGSLIQSVSQEFVPFENQQKIIQDVIEEIWNPLPQSAPLDYEPPEEFLQRGKAGVFDLAELVDLVKEENATEIVSITLPKELDYADHMLIVTARSPRHLMALATYVRKRYKMKHRKRTDVIPAIVSEDAKQGWIALDLGNIILHVFLQNQRDFYDLEMLWTVGPLFDDLYNAKDPEIIQMLNRMT